MKTIALVNQKGGVGKTTTTINIGAGLARKGKTVLLIDLDPQAHLTLSLGIKPHELEFTIYDLLKGDIDINELAIDLPGKLQLIPSSIRLSAAELEFAGLPGREYLLKETLAELKQKPDYILIDCPPSLGIFTINGLTAADEVYIPLQTEYLSLYGLGQLVEVVEVVQKRLNKKLKITGIIGTMFDSRKNLNKEVIARIEEHFGDKLFKTIIRTNVALAEAPSYGQDIFTYASSSSGAADYEALTDEIIRKGR